MEEAIKQIKTLNENIKKIEDKKELKFKFIYEEEFEKIKESVKKFGKISKDSSLIGFNESSILNDINLFINGLNHWKNNAKFELLYKKSRDGNSYKTFHQSCDNKGPTLTLIKSSEGFIIGGYTPLNWDTNSSWKSDNETFLFSLTKEKIFKKRKLNDYSIYCGKDVGPWFPYIGFRDYGKKDMTQGEFIYNVFDIKFESFNEIIPHEKKSRFFNVDEVEVYKMIFIH